MTYSEHYLTQPLSRAMRNNANSVASIDLNRSLSWENIETRVKKLGGLLQSIGLKPNDRVGILARNCDYYIEYLYGTLWAGGVVNPVNIRWTVREMAYSLENCETKILLVDANFAELIPEIKAAAPSLKHVYALFENPPTEMKCYETALAASSEIENSMRMGDDLAGIFYTGGTTGFPKGVMLSHRNLMSSALGSLSMPNCAAGEIVLHTAPLFHIGAMSGMIGALVRGSQHIFMPSFEPLQCMELIQKHKVSDVFMVPTMLQAVLDHPRFAEFDLSSISRIRYGAAPISPTLCDRAHKELPFVGFVQAYGMTELSPVATIMKPEEHLGDYRERGIIRGAGRAIYTAEVKIVGEDGIELPRRQVGEIAVRGEGVMLGYWNLPDKTAEVIKNGFMHTGDAGYMDEEGYIYVVDRIKDMIITGGENVFSQEVESVLSQHEAVSQCAIVGIPHDHWGEMVHAEIVLNNGFAPDDENIRNFCKQKLAGYKCPRSFGYVTELPLTAAGKIQKNEIRNKYKN